MDIGTNMADVLEIWADTGEKVERDFTMNEKEQREADAVNYAAAVAAAEQAAVEREQQRAVLLERLGLTADEFAILIGGTK